MRVKPHLAQIENIIIIMMKSVQLNCLCQYHLYTIFIYWIKLNLAHTSADQARFIHGCVSFWITHLISHWDVRVKS